MLFALNDYRKIARNISLIENREPGYEALLAGNTGQVPLVMGITGAPGSGKSTLTDALIAEMVQDGRRVAVLCVDPSSPFTRGAVLGDRIRMSEWYSHPNVFIRSLASRGSLGGLHPQIMGITAYLQAEAFDYIVVETVGVGQSEVDIAALADITIVVLVPESGDSIQSMKAGLMEIADLFVVNKSDRPGADLFYNNLKKMLGPVYKKHEEMLPVFRTVASERQGTQRLYEYLKQMSVKELTDDRKELLAQKAFTVLQEILMEQVDEQKFRSDFFHALKVGQYNIFRFAREYADKLKHL